MDYKPDSGFKQNVILPCLVLFALTTGLYWKALGFKFIPSWDDDVYVINNIYIFSLSLANLKALFTRFYLGNYTPIQMLSYSFDHALWGLNPMGYHLTNIILHGLNACAAYAVIRRITGKAAAAFAAALLFAVHPLNVENVAWVAERKTLLASLFSLLSILSYLRFRDLQGRIFYLLCWVFFIFGLLSKPLTVVLPLVLVSYEALLRPDDRKIRYAVPLFAASMAGALAAVMAHMGSGSIEPGTLSPGVLFGEVYPTMLPVYWKYIGMIIWPLNLAGLYDTARYSSFFQLPVLASLLAWAGVFVLVLGRGGAQLRFWFLWFWIWFLPVSNFVPIPVYFADRYMYLPAIALFVLFARLVMHLDVRGRMRGGLRLKKSIGCGVVAVVVLFYGILAFNRLDVWRNELVFWQDTAKKSPGLYKARLNLGYAYDVNGQFAEAEREYLAAIAIDPTPEAVNNLKMVRAKKRLSGD